MTVIAGKNSQRAGEVRSGNDPSNRGRFFEYVFFGNGHPGPKPAVFGSPNTGRRYGANESKEDWIMLVLSRKFGEAIVIGNSITITIMEVQGDRVRLGVSAPPEVPVHREEVQRKIEAGLCNSAHS